MKVILKKDVKGSGKAGDLVDVSDGYARNYLLKNGLADIATAGGVNAITQKKEADEHRKKVELAAAQELAAKLRGVTVTIKVKAGEKGRVFGSVSAQSIADQLNAQGFNVDKRSIIISGSIRSVGVHKLEIKPYPNVSAQFDLNVVAE